MGARRNIELSYKEGGKIYFYTHWDADTLEDILKEALKKGVSRWDDESYLARIIFSNMIRNSIDELTGYGIAPYPQDEQHPTIEVDLKRKTVNGVAFMDYITT